jgi:hypothetical protein
MINFAPFCEEKKCPHFIRWSCEGTCESCKLIGQSYNLDEYPFDCIHLEDIQDYESEQRKLEIKGI